jgi:4,5-DOPA dioxygenase extradiol
VSAHHDAAFEGGRATVTASAAPPTIHDFGGFPDELFAMRYPAPGDPARSPAASPSARRPGLTVAIDPDRGLDHGACAALGHLPDADLPVVQLSIVQRIAGMALRAWASARPAARRRRVDHRIGRHHPQSARFLHDLPAHRGAGPAWVSDFTAWIADRMEVNAIDDVLHAVDRAPRGRDNHPTPDHILPLFVAMGAGRTAKACAPGDFTPAPPMPCSRWTFTLSAKRPPPYSAAMLLSDRILFLDGEAIVLDKPEGLPVDPPRDGSLSLENHLDSLKFGFKRWPLAVHRLDRDTSGCLLLARNPKAHGRFTRAFEDREVEKQYLAILDGVPEPPAARSICRFRRFRLPNRAGAWSATRKANHRSRIGKPWRSSMAARSFASAPKPAERTSCASTRSKASVFRSSATPFTARGARKIARCFTLNGSS